MDSEEDREESLRALKAVHDDIVRNREHHVARYRQYRRQGRSGYVRWLMLIKELRVAHDLSILDAERMALANRHRRRWVEAAINSHQHAGNTPSPISGTLAPTP
jgi:hypothetical protein